MTNSERMLEIAGLRTTAVGAEAAPLVVVLLHGYAMQPADLTPFAHSLGLPALFLLPQGPQQSSAGGHGWWDIDAEARNAAVARGPRDLAEQYPPGLGAARDGLERFVEAVAAEYEPHCTVVGGFSQGGMLSLDFVLRGSRPVDGLVLMSASRIARADWELKRERLRGLPAFLSHGRADQDLAFAAGEALLAPRLTRRLIEAFVAGSAVGPADASAPAGRELEKLTPREREVLALVGRGKSNGEIAERLVLSPLTAKTHVARLFSKLGVRDRAQLVVAAYESGLIVARRDDAGST